MPGLVGDLRIREVGLPGLEPGTSSLSGCRRPGSGNGIDPCDLVLGRSVALSTVLHCHALTHVFLDALGPLWGQP
jgi:hypothetical protein